MSIYPEKGRNGYTGIWIVEVRDNGERKRFRTRSYEEALDIEEGRRSGLGATMGDLFESCKDVLWAGHKDATQSRQRLARTVGLLGNDKRVAEVQRQELDRMVSDFRRLDVSPKTINRHLAALSRALKWASEAEWIEKAPALPWQREGEGRKVWLQEHMTDAFLRAVTAHSGHSVKLGVEVLLYTGMRISELLTLSPADVVGDVIHLSHTKTGFPRSIPLPVGRGEFLRDWIMMANVSYRDILDGCNKASATLRLSPPITPHALRHTTATRLTAAGVPTLTVAEIMGHRSLATTRGYTHHEVDRLRAAMVCLLPGNAGETTLSETSDHTEKAVVMPPPRICSPLRSHSATRPKPKQS